MIFGPSHSPIHHSLSHAHISLHQVRKQLWLRIARHVIERDDGADGLSNMEAAMAVLQEAPGDMLKIEDVLPFFPDFVTIDHFKGKLLSRQK